MLSGWGTSSTSRFLSTPSARRATTVALVNVHTLTISIHALREEGDLALIANFLTSTLFLSTPSARRATPSGKGVRKV